MGDDNPEPDWVAAVWDLEKNIAKPVFNGSLLNHPKVGESNQ